MKNLIEILPNVFGVKVPSDAFQFALHLWSGTPFLTYLLNNNKTDRIDVRLIGNKLEFNPYVILGTLTKDEISFDASEVVGKIRNSFIQKTFYLNYKSTAFASGKYTFDNSEQSFRSALPDDIFFENPLQEPNCDCLTEYDREGCPDKCYQWINANNGITEKLLILQRL